MKEDIDSVERSNSHAVLLKIFEENNNFARFTFRAIVGWYSFFITANLLAGGWFMSPVIKNLPIPLNYLIIWGVVFLTSNLLAIRYTTAADQVFYQHYHRASEILRRLDLASKNNDGLDLNPVPIQLYSRALLYMRITYWCTFILWIFGTILATPVGQYFHL